MATTGRGIKSSKSARASKSSSTNEETEPLAGEEEEGSAFEGIPGQLMYPDKDVDAERAGQFAAGKVDTLDPNEEEKSDRERIQDDIDNYPRDDEDE